MWNTPVHRRERAKYPPDSHAGIRGKVSTPVPPLLLEVWARALPCSPAGSKGRAPRRWGLGRGADFTPLPLWPLMVQEHPTRSSAAGGGGSGAAPSLQRRGEERAWARGRHPRSATRASKAPHAQGRAQTPKGRRPRVAPEPTLVLLPPLLYHSAPTPPTRSRPQTPH